MARWRFVVFVLTVMIGGLAIVQEGIAGAAPAPASAASPVPCPVTQPNGDVPPELVVDPDEFEGGYGNDALWTNVWMWGEDGVDVPSTHAQSDGSLGPMKWAWYRYVPGELTIEGRLLDGEASALRVEMPDGYGDSGFQPVGLIFSRAGCWEITGSVDGQSLTFVVMVKEPVLESTPVAG